MVTQDIQARNYFSLLESARYSGVVSHAFFWTLDYAPSSAAVNRDGTTGPGVPPGGYPISDAYSLVQVQYVSGKPQTTYTTAFTLLKNYITRFPQWNGQAGTILNVLGMDGLIRVPTVASPGPRDNNTISFGQTSDNQLYKHSGGTGAIAFLNSEGQIFQSGVNTDFFQYGTNKALNQEITFRFSTSNALDQFGLLARMSGASANAINAYGLILQGNVLNVVKITNGVSAILQSIPFSQLYGAFYRMRFHVNSSTPTILKGSVWAANQVEPNWLVMASDSNFTIPPGGFGMYANAASNNPLLFDSLMAIDASSAGLIYRLPQTIANAGSLPLTWQAASNQFWCTTDIVSGTISSGGTQIFNILIDVSSLVSGTSTASVAITTNGGNFTIPVSISIP